MNPQEKTPIVTNESIHEWFELTYASYLVLPRSILQSAPAEWQGKFVACLDELEAMFGTVPKNGTYHVTLKNKDGRFIEDYYKDYERGRRKIPMIRELEHGNQNQAQPDRGTVSPLRSVGNAPATGRQDG